MTKIRRQAATLFLMTALGAPGLTAGQRPAGPEEARTVLAQAVEAMGGKDRLTSLRTLKLSVFGHNYALEQSERPEGPWLVIYREREELRDVQNRRRIIDSRSRFWSVPEWRPPSTTVVAGGVAARTNGTRWAPGAPVDIRDADDVFALAPERLLFTAEAASDLRLAAPVILHDIPQDVLAFSVDQTRVELHLNRWTHLPTMLRIARWDDTFGIWGDVVEQRWYSFWTLEAGGLMYPRQTIVELNGQPHEDTTVLGLEVDVTIDEARFAIPDETRTAFAEFARRPFGLSGMRLDASRATTVAPGIVQLAGGWNVLLVRQDDGIVVVEGPISSRYSADVIAAAEQTFPGLPVKAVVSTSDAWPHIGGMREYVARGIAALVLDLNVPILDRLIRATRSQDPDRLSTSPRRADWQVVSDRTTFGSGANPMELIPVRGELGERMMLIWFPEARLLYASDMIQRNRDGSFFMPSMLADVEAAVRRAGVAPERALAMHSPPLPWAEVTDALKAIRGR